jgi:hypothetical protein
VRALADAVGWQLRQSGEPHTSKVTRALRKLAGEKLAEKVRGSWRLTAAGREKAEALASEN